MWNSFYWVKTMSGWLEILVDSFVQSLHRMTKLQMYTQPILLDSNKKALQTSQDLFSRCKLTSVGDNHILLVCILTFPDFM